MEGEWIWDIGRWWERDAVSRGTVLSVLMMLAAAHPLAAQTEPEAPAEPSGSSGDARVDMSLIPLPTLENLEEGVRSQLEGLRRAVEAIVEKGEASDQDLGGSLGRLGSLYLLYDYIPAAEACLVLARQLDPENFRWLYYLGALYTLEGQVEKAQEALASALAIDPEHVPALIRQGNLFIEAGDVDAAETNFEAALELDPESSAARFGLGQVAFNREQYEAAISLLEASLEGQPEGSVVHYFLGMALRNQGDMEGARQHLRLNKHEQVTFRDPLLDELSAANVSREAFFNMGVEALRREEPERALKAFEMALEAEPNDPETHYNVGMALLGMGKGEEAVVHIRRATELRPDYRNAHFNLGVLLARKGDDQEALHHFERAAEIDPDDPRAQVRWAEALARVGQQEAAIEKLEAVLEIDPAFVMARLSLASVLAKEGQLEAAEANFREILALAPGAVPERAEAHFRLALLDPQRPRGEVIEHLRAAVELDPDFYEAHHALGGELARREDYEGAADSFARAIELEPTDLSAHFGQAMALILGGLYTQALQELEQSVRVLPNSLPLAHALARLLATCPDPQVRDGQRALELSQSIVDADPTIDHAETLAMALAEVGRFEEAIIWQREVLSQEQKMEGEVSSERRRRLEQYKRGEPIRAPWMDG